MTRGAQLLQALLKGRGAQWKLSKDIGIDQGHLSRIANGERVPGLYVRRMLKPLGIPLDAWDEAPQKKR